MTNYFASQPQLFVLPNPHLHHQIWLLEKLQQQGILDSQIVSLNQERGEEKNLSINHVRELISQASQIAKKTHFLLLHLETASLEAQQALLKILEEPPTLAHLYLTTNNLESVLPTIQSRCQIIISADYEVNIEPQFQTLINQFDPKNMINNSEGQIIQLIENTLKDLVSQQKNSDVVSETETVSALERSAVKKLLSYLVQHVFQQLTEPRSVLEKSLLVFSLKQFQTTSEYCQANVNSKLLLEDCYFQIKNYSKALK